MREMKDSGIEWIGEIPSDWELTKIGSVYDERNTKVNDEEYPPLSVTKQGVVPQLETAAKTDNGDNRKLICKNDFVINSRSDRRGSCGISDYEGSCSLINTVLMPQRHMCNRYYGYVFKSDLFADEYYRWGHGIVDDLWSTKWSDMKNIYIPMPQLLEQELRADYLDSKCSKIEEIITKQEKIIEKLKEYKSSVITEAVTKGLNPDAVMKDSGIDWIGKIPAHWNTVKIKNLGKYRNGLTYSPEDIVDENDGTLVLRSSNIQNGKLAFEDNVYVNVKDEASRVKKGDILICSRNGSRALIGKNALIESDINAFFGAFMMIFRCIDPRYIRYILNSNIFNYYLGSFFTSTINQLTGGNFGNMIVPFCPDEDERNTIVEYLNEKVTWIDDKINKKSQLISKLASYKQSLIYEVVTGKKEV